MGNAAAFGKKITLEESSCNFEDPVNPVSPTINIIVPFEIKIRIPPGMNDNERREVPVTLIAYYGITYRDKLLRAKAAHDRSPARNDSAARRQSTHAANSLPSVCPSVCSSASRPAPPTSACRRVPPVVSNSVAETKGSSLWLRIRAMLVNKLAKPLAKRTTATVNNRVPLHAETTSRTTARISVTSSALLLAPLQSASRLASHLAIKRVVSHNVHLPACRRARPHAPSSNNLSLSWLSKETAALTLAPTSATTSAPHLLASNRATASVKPPLALVNPSVSKPVPTPANKLLRLWSRVSSPLPAVDAAAVIPSVEGRAVADAEHYFSPEDRETRKLNSTTHVVAVNREPYASPNASNSAESTARHPSAIVDVIPVVSNNACLMLR
uniref:Arrestin_C domain-containing protein n=1 Tax=Heterorhabditis bacteriophora TaxID=37862 RepID=A0A1I7X3Q6_HETBA